MGGSMMQMARGFVLALAVVAIAWPSHGQPVDPGLAGRDWQIVEVAGRRVDGAGSLRLEAERMAGRAACNQFSATVAARSGGVTIGPLVTTRMFCAQRMALEQATLSALASVRRIERRGDGVAMLAGDGAVAVLLAAAR